MISRVLELTIVLDYIAVYYILNAYRIHLDYTSRDIDLILQLEVQR